MSKLYTSVPVPKFPSNTFNFSRSAIGSMSFHKMYCSECIEVIPGDGFVAGTETFGRAEPMVAPPMARQDCDHHTFFVPNWQLNNHFDDFITGGEKMDFHDHMPWVSVDSIYQLIHVLLDWDYLPETLTLAETSVLQRQLVQEANFRTDLAMRILEHCDWFRAIPFVKPDFLPPVVYHSDQWDNREVEDMMDANLSAFVALNSNLANSPLRVNLLPFAAYLKTWCEYFRDENLVSDFWDFIDSSDSIFTMEIARFRDLLDDVSEVLEAAVDNLTSSYLAPIWSDLTELQRSDLWKDLEFFALKPRAWRKDRYTAALPWTQKGPDVLIPLAGSFEVENTDNFSSNNNVVYNIISKEFYQAGDTSKTIKQNVDLSQNNGQGATIRDLRRAFAAESFSEADGQFGNRYPENTLGQFGVFTPDSRLPRSQFIGSNTQNFVTSEIAQTSESGDTPQGNLAGKGTVYGSHRLFRGVYTMHGFIVVFSSLRVQALYESGIHPMFSRYDRTEYAWPRFARLGEEPLYLKELYVSGEDNDNNVSEDEVFGYVPRYSSYKSDQSSVHGLLKGSRNYWTFSRRFGSKPKLNEEFIYSKPRLDSFAVVNPYEDQFTVEIDFHVRSRRKLPYWGTPMI